MGKFEEIALMRDTRGNFGDVTSGFEEQKRPPSRLRRFGETSFAGEGRSPAGP